MLILLNGYKQNFGKIYDAMKWRSHFQEKNALWQKKKKR